MFLTVRQGYEQLLTQGELWHTACRVCSEPDNLLDGWFSSPESAAEQEADGSHRSHLSPPRSSRYKSALLNDGLVAGVKLFQSVSLPGGSYRHQITI